jgi:zinc transport system permease protein
MLDILNYEFIQNAILASLLVSIASGIIGTLVVVNRMVFLAGGIAHSAYGGIGLALFFDLPLLISASAFSIFSALIIALVLIKIRDRLDLFIGIIWAVGMAIGILLIDLTEGYNVDLFSYLFGSILAVSSSDIIYLFILDIIIIATVVISYQKLLAISYDSEFAQIRGVNVTLYNTILLVLVALAIVASIRVVGLIMVIALFTIPIYLAEQLSNSLSRMMGLSAIISTLFTLIGLYFSYNYDLTAGAVIILTSAIFLILFLLGKFLINKRQ